MESWLTLKFPTVATGQMIVPAAVVEETEDHQIKTNQRKRLVSSSCLKAAMILSLASIPCSLFYVIDE